MTASFVQPSVMLELAKAGAGFVEIVVSLGEAESQ
jgi:hypothetical protein